MCKQEQRIDESVLREIHRLGITDQRPHQMKAIKTFMQGKDVFVSFPTGCGKSLIFSVLPYVYDDLHGLEGSSVIIKCLALTATATVCTRNKIVRILGMKNPAVIVTSPDKANVSFWVKE